MKKLLILLLLIFNTLSPLTFLNDLDCPIEVCITHLGYQYQTYDMHYERLNPPDIYFIPAGAECNICIIVADCAFANVYQLDSGGERIEFNIGLKVLPYEKWRVAPYERDPELIETYFVSHNDEEESDTEETVYNEDDIYVWVEGEHV